MTKEQIKDWKERFIIKFSCESFRGNNEVLDGYVNDAIFFIDSLLQYQKDELVEKIEKIFENCEYWEDHYLSDVISLIKQDK